MEKVATRPAEHSAWHMRRVLLEALEDGPKVQLAFAVCSDEHSKVIQDLFSWWVLSRHQNAYELMDGADAFTTVGVLITPRVDREPPWDTTMTTATGDAKLTPSEAAALNEAWPMPD